MDEDRLRIGIGYDIHRLVEGRPLVLGGVRIPYSRGLLGHSDADAVLHAVTDALLGAAGLPDIGELYPDHDPAFENADSRSVLADAVRRVGERGFRASHVDVIVHAEAPKMSAYKRAMAGSIAGLAGVPSERVNVKAKTNEGLDAVGRGEAIACTAVVMIEKV